MLNDGVIQTRPNFEFFLKEEVVRWRDLHVNEDLFVCQAAQGGTKRSFALVD